MAKKKAAKKKAGGKKVARKKAARKKGAKRPASPKAARSTEKERADIRIVKNTWKAVPRSKARVRGRLLCWINEDSQDLSVVFDPGFWPFTEAADDSFLDPDGSGQTVHVVHVDGDKPSGWFTVDPNAQKIAHDYNITPRGQESGPKVPPGPDVSPTDP